MTQSIIMKNYDIQKRITINEKSYSIQKKLGSGSYGNVYLAYSTNYVQVAIKEIKSRYNLEGIEAPTLRELNILMDCQNEHIIKLIDFEYKPNGNTC
jgi:serine/threonine protein kinase